MYNQPFESFLWKASHVAKDVVKIRYVDVIEALSWRTWVEICLVSQVHQTIPFEINHDFICFQCHSIEILLLHGHFDLIHTIDTIQKFLLRTEVVRMTSQRKSSEQIYGNFSIDCVVIKLYAEFDITSSPQVL